MYIEIRKINAFFSKPHFLNLRQYFQECIIRYVSNYVL